MSTFQPIPSPEIAWGTTDIDPHAVERWLTRYPATVACLASQTGLTGYSVAAELDLLQGHGTEADALAAFRFGHGIES